MKNSFKNLTSPELRVKRDELYQKSMDFRFQMVVGHVDNPLQKRVLRRQIARVNTLVREHEIAEQKQAQTDAKAQQDSADSKAQKA